MYKVNQDTFEYSSIFKGPGDPRSLDSVDFVSFSQKNLVKIEIGGTKAGFYELTLTEDQYALMRKVIVLVKPDSLASINIQPEIYLNGDRTYYTSGAGRRLTTVFEL